MKVINLTVLLAAALLAFSCISGPVEISEDLTQAELVQRAQEASDRNNYSVSLQYYEAVIQRFPYDAEYVCGAEYEIAFIHYKQNKYGEAKAEFTELLARYATPGGEELPPQFKILSEKIVARITEIEEARNNH